MKKKVGVFIATVMALTMTFSLAACNDGGSSGPNGPYGLLPTIAQVNEKVQNMPTSTDESAIENAIDEVFGVEIELPDGTCSAQTVSYGGASVYMVTVSGANTTEQSYYDSIKAKMLAEGYTAEESELAFYKVVGSVVYSVAVEGDNGDILVVTGVSDMTQSVMPSGTIPDNPITPDNPSNLPTNRTTWLTADEMAELHIDNLAQPAGTIVEVIGDSFDGFGLTSVWFEFSLTDVTVEEFESYCEMLYTTLGANKGYGGEEEEFCISENMSGVMKSFDSYYLYNDDGFKGEIYAYHYSESGESYGVTWEQNTMSIRITYANY